MTFAELVLFFLVAALFYRLLRPVRTRVERMIRRWLRSSRAPSDRKPVIDITDYSSKKSSKGKERPE